MAWYFFEFLIGILAIIGMAAIACAVILVWTLARHGTEPDDEWHRLEDQEQMEYLQKWREEHGKH